MKYCMNTFKGKVRIAEISMEENRCGNSSEAVEQKDSGN